MSTPERPKLDTAYAAMRYAQGVVHGTIDGMIEADLLKEKLARYGPPYICGVMGPYGPNGEMLACGWIVGHEGDHAWSTLPTWPMHPR